MDLYERYAQDLLRDRFYMSLERRLLWVWINVAQWVAFFSAGLAIGWATTGELVGGVQFGLSLLVWGVFVRTVLVWHITWSVNSVTHLWGYRNYETDENSRNNMLVGIVGQRRGLAQQPPRPAASCRPRTSLVGARRHLPHNSPAPGCWSGHRRRPHPADDVRAHHDEPARGLTSVAPRPAARMRWRPARLPGRDARPPHAARYRLAIRGRPQGGSKR